MLHAVKPNEGAGAPKTRLAVDSNSAAFIFSRGKELRYNLVRRRRSVNEEQVKVADALLDEFVLFVLGLVQSRINI